MQNRPEFEHYSCGFLPLLCDCLGLGCYNKMLWTSGTDIYFSQFQSLGSPRLRCQPSWILVRALLLVCRWLPSCCALTGQRAGSPVFSFCKNAHPIMREPPLWPHITQITSEGPASKYCFTGNWGFFQHFGFWRDTVSPEHWPWAHI